MKQKRNMANPIFKNEKQITRYIKKHGKYLYLRLLRKRLESYVEYRQNNNKSDRGNYWQKMFFVPKRVT